MTQANRRPHPTLSDVALALATRHSEPLTNVKISDANAKGIVQIDVSVNDPDPEKASKTASALYKVLRAQFPVQVTP